jgi:hypothetical protein
MNWNTYASIGEKDNIKMDLKQKRVRVWTKEVNLQAITNEQVRLNASTSFISWPTAGFLT